MTQTSYVEVYSIDTSSLMHLDGRDWPPPVVPAFSPAERGVIWCGLEQLARGGGLKLIRQVKEELRLNHPEALKRLSVYPGHKAARLNNRLRLRYQNLLAKYPKLIPRYPNTDPADPWLVVYAQEYALVIVTEELPTGVRKSKSRTIPIPDVCQQERVPWMDIRTLANHLGWLP